MRPPSRPSALLAPALRFVLVGAFAGLGSAAWAAGVAERFAPEVVAGVTLSPDGSRLAARTLVDGQYQIVVDPLDGTPPRVITSSRDSFVMDLSWVGSDRLLFRLGRNREGVRTDIGGLYAVDADGTDLDVLQSSVRRDLLGGLVFALVPGAILERPTRADGELIVENYDYVSGMSFAVAIRADGRGTRQLAPNPGDVVAWIVRDGELRGRVRREGIHGVIEWREDRGSWSRQPMESDKAILGVLPRLDPDGNLWVVGSPDGTGTQGLYRLVRGEVSWGEPAFRHPRYDVEGVVERDGRPVAVEILAGRPRMIAIDPALAGVVAAIDAALPGRRNSWIEFAPRGEGWRVLLRTSSPTAPPTWAIFDYPEGGLRPISYPPAWWREEAEARTAPVAFTARDGLRIEGLVTVPAGRAPRGLPFVVLPHGGPASMDILDWNDEVQFLASLGYGVFRVNFRGSTGYGAEFRDAGRGRWGSTMPDDVTDGVEWLVAQGVADPANLAIVGSSFGGYVALNALVREPGRYRGGIIFAGATDPRRFLARSDRREDRLRRAATEAELGSGAVEPYDLLDRVDRIQAPLLVVHGELDGTVPIEQAQALVQALRRARKPHEFVRLANTGHGFYNDRERREYYARVAEFLRTVLGPGA